MSILSAISSFGNVSSRSKRSILALGGASGLQGANSSAGGCGCEGGATVGVNAPVGALLGNVVGTVGSVAGQLVPVVVGTVGSLLGGGNCGCN
ncbi:hypothetical protein DICPUDRAFT_148854 [Dictyostelium purpureum]|uniref:HssA/2C/7E family protein n=1 Tax=Dictyostelium purpureum TaxID=5786 RepID=F0ZC63_DICPU|nr:uncharacterized protein DICPUDRAFT_148854 [Dictyostelium purpureum]EGC38441.1 hypothetical protein DICPUDRAFT_148854 [Dictyostelium purpureum]|eukprot:XP_003284999.1 hypothetical protein DICPUDRAFT_148854 [Dictyostelium purpureum]